MLKKRTTGVDQKEEDLSAESREDHIKYYRSLNGMIASMQEELGAETEDVIVGNLKGRITAMNEDKKRIEGMFPEVDWDKVS